ncbi:CLUMA_CG016437, isoform A [Nephila pilipes]|uniref:CLUMA_CG016437, isoform A n=1 Tax=Nephila pilipes TaxID=299642 RepID=A0A8X6QVJ5_NEPPI|nr:CLUMA_CG016437, isoform A [Nephila pilipes]
MDETYHCNFKALSQDIICGSIPPADKGEWILELKENNISEYPVTLVTKLLPQHLWEVKLSWDQEVDSNSKSQFCKWSNDLKCLERMRIPRWLNCDLEIENVSLLFFSDARETKPECTKYEHWDECNAHCQKNCSNYKKSFPCPLMCKPGCICDEGYVRGPDGNCIPIIECPKTEGSPNCPPNEHYELCGSICPITCFEEERRCPYNCCKEGCFCNKGLVRRPDGKCVVREECPLPSGNEKERRYSERSCPPREHMSRCRGHCQKTCDKKEKPCPETCEEGCVCDGGRVRGPDRKCIEPNKCPGNH